MGAWSLKTELLTIPSGSDLDPRDKGLRPVGTSKAALGTSGHNCTLGGGTLYTHQGQTLRLLYWVCYVGIRPTSCYINATSLGLLIYKNNSGYKHRLVPALTAQK